jgi:hypothetical protein
MKRTVVYGIALGMISMGFLSIYAQGLKSGTTSVEWTSPYNGKDLTGWSYKTGKPFDGQKESSDGRYMAKGDTIVVNDGKGIRQLWTTTEYSGDMEIRVEFRADVNADSGFFVRGPQLQVRDYLVAGPYKMLKKYKPQEWNEIVIVIRENVAHCTCNGEILEENLKVPAKGGIGLEADHGILEYRNIRIKKLQ